MTGAQGKAGDDAGPDGQACQQALFEIIDSMSDQFEEFSSSASAFQGVASTRTDGGELNERYRYLLDNTPAIIYSSVPSGDSK